MGTQRRHRSAWFALGAACALTLTTGPALAVIPSHSTRTITGCYARSNGALRLIDVDARQTCSRHEERVTWNVAGPAGPAGPAGAQGVQGAKGDTGAAGAPGTDGADGEDGKDGVDGAPGASAYDVATANGFLGSQQEWLTSLVGPRGASGSSGPVGPSGASAYDVATANGFVGTQQQWLASLVGPKGDPGSSGAARVFFGLVNGQPFGPDRTVVASKDLPAGAFTIQVAMTLSSGWFEPVTVECDAGGPGQGGFYNAQATVEPGEKVTLPLAGLLGPVDTPRTFTIACSGRAFIISGSYVLMPVDGSSG